MATRKISEILLKAAKRVQKGWIRWNMFQDNRVCAVGAISEVAKGYISGSGSEAVRFVEFQLQNEGLHNSLFTFNDVVARDKRDVVRKLRKYARIAQKEGL